MYAGISKEEWQGNRRRYIGGSDVAAILGLSPWRTPVSVYLEKTGKAPAQPENIAMKIGTELEALVAKMYTDETGREVRNHNKMIVDGVLCGNIDRLVVPAGEKIAALKGKIRTNRILECKTASRDWSDDEVPIYYQTQVQHYMGLCPGVEFADVACLFVVHKAFKVFTIKRDQELIDVMKARVIDWWNKYIETNTCPPPTNEDDCKLIWERSNPGKSIVADDVLSKAVADLKEINANIKDLEEKAGALKNGICAALGDTETLLGANGAPLVTWKSAKDSAKVDYKGLVESLNIDAEKIAEFTKVAPGARRFLVK